MKTSAAPSIEHLASNVQGLALAAFAPVAAIELLLGCDRAKAEAFQEKAITDFQRLRRAIDDAKRVRA